MAATKSDDSAQKLEALIDEIGELTRRRNLEKPYETRLKFATSLLLEHFTHLPAETSAIVTGKQYEIQISPRENQTTINSINKVFRLLGQSKFLKICTLTLKRVKEAVHDEAAFEALVTTERTGVRSIKAVPLGSPTAE